jgi:hypothetical protein
MSHVTSHDLATEGSDATACIQQLASLILHTNAEFENVWNIANRVCDQYAMEIAAIPSKPSSTRIDATAA